MGVITEAIISHSLSPTGIIQFVEKLNNSAVTARIGGKWEWNIPDVNDASLETFWKKTYEDYLKDRNIIILENGRYDLFFYQRYIVTFSSGLKSGIYQNNPFEKAKFDELAKSIALAMGAAGAIISEDWYHYHAFEDDDPFDVIKQNLLKMSLPFYEIDLTV